jgi:thiol:disulfide interchange protein
MCIAMSYQAPAYRSTNTLSVVSLVFGIAAWCVVPVLGAVVAIVCGHLARAEIRRVPAGSMEGDGMALAGLLLGYVQLAFIALAMLFLFGALLLGFGIASHFLHG